ncbi:hypothetical protein GY45DRAFT_1334895 [Cubamyces sp. BRFM 1775]|nr:hypothetical protein GY45DRAFT_1334895 [Cubamyces sp. BRFM 1775]
MPSVESPNFAIAPVPSSPQSRNNRSGRLPTYRSTYIGRFHPYARFVSPKRRDEEQMAITDSLQELEGDNLPWEMVAAPRPRVCICTEALDRDTHPYEDDPLNVPEDEAVADAFELNVPRASKVAAIINDLFAAFKRRYLAIVSTKDFFGAK